MDLKRGSVLGVFLCSLVFVGTVEAQSQGVPGRLASLQAQVDQTSMAGRLSTLQGQLDQAMATIKELQAALASEAGARKAADLALAASISGSQGGGVTATQLELAMGSQSSAWSAKLAEAIAAEASTRAAADAALEGQIANEAAARKAGDQSLAPLMTLAPLATHVSVHNGTINDLAGPHVIFSGANVHIRNGHRSGDSLTPNGLGNLIVGYNESAGYADPERGGSHNVVVGVGHRYSFGTGLVAGYANRLAGSATTVSGGGGNEATDFAASVAGGSNNRAGGLYSSVLGGDSNAATGANAAVCAGGGNQATGDLSSVLGGASNTASALFSTVGGGSGLTNAGSFSFIP